MRIIFKKLYSLLPAYKLLFILNSNASVVLEIENLYPRSEPYRNDVFISSFPNDENLRNFNFDLILLLKKDALKIEIWNLLGILTKFERDEMEKLICFDLEELINHYFSLDKLFANIEKSSLKDLSFLQKTFSEQEPILVIFKCFYAQFFSNPLKLSILKTNLINFTQKKVEKIYNEILNIIKRSELEKSFCILILASEEIEMIYFDLVNYLFDNELLMKNSILENMLERHQKLKESAKKISVEKNRAKTLAYVNLKSIQFLKLLFEMIHKLNLKQTLVNPVEMIVFKDFMVSTIRVNADNRTEIYSKYGLGTFGQVVYELRDRKTIDQKLIKVCKEDETYCDLASEEEDCGYLFAGERKPLITKNPGTLKEYTLEYASDVKKSINFKEIIPLKNSNKIKSLFSKFYFLCLPETLEICIFLGILIFLAILALAHKFGNL